MRRLTAPCVLATLVLATGCATVHIRQIDPDARIALPADHAPHPRAQTEWWHVHADLTDVQTDEQVHLFAGFVTERTDLDSVAGLPIAPLANPYQTAYVQIVTERGGVQRGRYSFPLGSVRSASDGLDLRHGPWRIAWEEGAVIIEVGAGRQHLRLRLDPTRPTTIPGGGGPVQIVPGTRHLWYQDEGMAAQGRWSDRGQTRWVTGTAFFKHQWGRLYDPDVQGFEWFSFDLPGERSVVVVKVHSGGRTDGPGSLAFISTAGGPPRRIDAQQIDLERTARWRSPASGASWPVAWRLSSDHEVPMDLQVDALHHDQELVVFPAAFYAGPVRVRGRFDGQDVDTIGFVEHVGGWAPALRPLYRSDQPEEEPPPVLARGEVT